MAKKLSEHLDLDSSVLRGLGAFDPILSVDSKFFIDPKSLEVTSAPEFKHAREKLSERYSQIFSLLHASKSVDDKFWKAAFNHFPKGEVEEICVGYGFDNTGGRGIGPELVNKTLDTVNEFINSGIDDPVLLELVGLFQKGVGSDIVSDMIARTLLDEIIEYTSRISLEISHLTSVKLEAYTHNGKEAVAFRNPHNKKRLLLLPFDILQPLPVAYDWDSVDQVSEMNRRVRSEFAKMVGAFNWKRARTKANKDVMKEAMLRHPIAVKDLLRQYNEKSPKEPYDFESDPSGEYAWLDAAKDITDSNPLSLSAVSTPHDVELVVRKIIDKFRDVVENNGGWTSFYTRGKGSKIMHESYAQKLFFGVADSYCDANNLDISPETNSGRGPIDFKFSNGKRAKVLVEIKLTSNGQLRHGFTTQVGEYEKAEKPYTSHYVVLKVTDTKDYSNALNTAIGEAAKEKKQTPTIDHINAQKQAPASKA